LYFSSYFLFSFLWRQKLHSTIVPIAGPVSSSQILRGCHLYSLSGNSGCLTRIE
jgi:hypothetical protein